VAEVATKLSWHHRRLRLLNNRPPSCRSYRSCNTVTAVVDLRATLQVAVPTVANVAMKQGRLRQLLASRLRSGGAVASLLQAAPQMPATLAEVTTRLPWQHQRLRHLLPPRPPSSSSFAAVILFLAPCR